MPRSSLPSISITCAYGTAWIRLNRICSNLISAGRLSASTTARTSAPTSCMTWAVRRDLVDRRHLRLGPADPRRSPLGDDLDLASGAFEQPAAVLAQLGVSAAVNLAPKAERAQQLDHPSFVLGGVGRVLEHLVELGVGI